MSENDPILIRKLNSREKRRLTVHGMLPLDAIDPSCSTDKLIGHNQAKHLYRYGCRMAEVNLEIEPDTVAVKKRNLIFHLRGFPHQFPISILARLIKTHSLPLSIFLFPIQSE